jgi:hypothetical protein
MGGVASKPAPFSKQKGAAPKCRCDARRGAMLGQVFGQAGRFGGGARKMVAKAQYGRGCI